MRNRGSGVKAALTHRSLTKENPIPHAQMDHIHPQNQSYRLPVLLQTVVISFSREDSARAKTHSFQYKPRDRPKSAPAFFQRSKNDRLKNEQIMPQVHPQCIFANAAYNPCECIAILKLNGQRKHSQDKGHHKNRTVIKRRIIGCPRGYRNVVCQTKGSRP